MILGGSSEGADGDYRVRHAINEIYKTYGHRVSLIGKGKSLLKFGRNEAVTNVATGSTIMTLPAGQESETYATSNSIDKVSSSNNSDTVELVIEGHTLSGSDLTFVTQSVTLTGQSKATLSTPLYRMTRMYNNGSTNLLGTIYGYEDTAITAGVPTDGTKVHCMIRATTNQSEKASTSLSSTDYWLISSVTVSVLEKVAAFAQAELEIRLFGKVFRSADILSAAAGSSYNETYDPLLIVRPNSDVRIKSVASGAGTDVAATIHGYLATIN